jgi:protein-L-isoaspartate(D-aspartate) O-methyltransferase
VVTRRDESCRALSSISQPSMVAQMLDILDLRAGLRVLEIGAGTGYCAALIAELVGPTGKVTTVDLDPEVTDEAHRNLDANGYSRVQITCADGALGEPSGAPWDRIIVSVGAWEPAPEWIAQLAPDGKIVMPLGIRKVQRIVAFEPTAFGLRSTKVLAGGFLAQRGRDAGPRTTVPVDEAIAIESEDEIGIDAAAARYLLDTEPATVWTGAQLPFPGRFDRLIVYLALHHAGMFTLTAPRTFLPGALRAWNVVYGVASADTLAHLALRAIDPEDPETSHEVGVHAYGPESAALADKLADDLRSWARMPEADPVFEVHPKADPIESEESGGLVLDKRHSRIRVTWPTAPTADHDGARPPAVHDMRLLEEYMALLERGEKSVEIRCDDPKRRDISEGDQIVFRCGNRSVRTQVARVSRYATFAELYESEDAAAINPRRSAAEQFAGIEDLYGPDKRALGAVAIEIRLLSDPQPAKGKGEDERLI